MSRLLERALCAASVDPESPTGVRPGVDGIPSRCGLLMPKHDGHPADCWPSPGGLFENGPFTAMFGGRDGDRWTLVGRFSGSASDARLTFSDGTPATLAIDPDTLLVQWTGPAAPTPTKIEGDGETCALLSAESSDTECQGANIG